MDFIMSLPPSDFIALISKALEKRDESRAWDIWVAGLPYTDKNNFVPFEDFYTPRKLITVQRRTREEVLAEAAAIRRAVGGGHHRDF